jgi:GntR family transcriptional repressor for pyruvate dehydrogenase complex
LAFQRIETKRKSLLVVEQLTQAIRHGHYQTGSRLPPERIIAEQMGVSRPSVREALSALQLAGVVESRPGDGTYVAGVPERSEAAVSFLEQQESPVEAMEARRILERAIVQAAAARPSPQGVAGVARALETMREAARARDYEAFTTANGAFHLAIIRAIGNDLLERAISPLIDVMQRQLGLEMRRREYALDGAFFDAMYGVHRDVFEALERGDAGRAAVAMDRHFDLIEASLRGDGTDGLIDTARSGSVLRHPTPSGREG